MTEPIVPRESQAVPEQTCPDVDSLITVFNAQVCPHYITRFPIDVNDPTSCKRRNPLSLIEGRDDARAESGAG